MSATFMPFPPPPRRPSRGRGSRFHGRCGEHLRPIQAAIRAGHYRQTKFDSDSLSLNFVSIARIYGDRTNECDTMLSIISANSAFSDEADTWMNCICVCNCCGRNYRRHVEVAVLRSGWSDTHRFVCEAYMHCIRVRGRMRPQFGCPFAAGAMDTKSDFAAICDEDLVEQGECPKRKRPADGRIRPAGNRLRLSFIVPERAPGSGSSVSSLR